METESLSDRQRLIEIERGQSMRQILSGLTEQGMNLRQIAQELGVSESTVHYWLRKVKAVRRYYIPPAQ